MKLSSLLMSLCGRVHKWVRVVCLGPMLTDLRYWPTGVTAVVVGLALMVVLVLGLDNIVCLFVCDINDCSEW